MHPLARMERIPHMTLADIPRSSRQAFFLGLFLLSAGTTALASDPAAPSQTIAWQPWSDSIFTEAEREHKFVLLDLQAVWCHWCHVMDEKTYADPRVIALIQSRYIAVRVDQDSRPDLANRYQDYGWPATVVFNSDGGEIVKRQGYLPPEQMTSMLQAIIDDPTPGPSVTNAKSPSLDTTAAQVGTAILTQQLLNGYDAKLGGWSTVQKFLNWDNVEYCLVQAKAGNAGAEKMARQTLDDQLKLVDPAWGGVDQYSAEGDWDHPHFEKIMQMQAKNMRIYAEAYTLWKNIVYLKTAEGIYGYVREFLTSPDGVVYVSQDADLIPGEHGGEYFKLDDAGRRKLGLPRVDQHIYARENGWFIEALTTLYSATGNARYRDEAVHAADWIMTYRSLSGGGFRHGDEKNEPISLGDTLSMGRAFLALYTVTGDRAWLDHAEQAAAFIHAHFAYHAKGTAIGFAAAADEPAASLFAPEPDFDENVNLARFANLLFHYSGNARERHMAETALHFAATPEIAKARLSSVGGLILAEQELATDPLHIAIVGKKDDAIAKKLFATALAYPWLYKQVEWIDKSEKDSAPDAALYPDLPQSAAYTCANQACSAPVFDETHLVDLLNHKTSPK
jgi:uncharacterized protein YyaL (SSP411 family)